MSINEIVSAIESLTLIECSELVKALEEKFGVVAAAPVAAGAGAAAPYLQSVGRLWGKLGCVDLQSADVFGHQLPLRVGNQHPS